MRNLLILAGLLIGGRPGAPESGAGEPVRAPGLEPERPAAATGRPSAPACALAEDGGILLAWESRTEGGEADILFRRRSPGPAGGWRQGPVRLDTDPPGASRSLEPRIAAGRPGTVYVAWQDARDGKDDIRVRCSPDGGSTWLPEIRVDGDPPGAAVSSMPALAADGEERVYLAWEDQRNGDRDIYFARSTDGGSTFEPDRRLDAGEPGAGVSYHPELLCWNDGTVLVFWRDERDGLADAYVRRSPDGGATWDPERRLDSGDPGRTASMHLGVAARGERAAAVWDEAGGEVLGVLFDGSGKSGWGPPFRVAGDRRSAFVPDDPLTAAAAGRGVIPAAALAGSPILWAGASGERIWYVVSDGDLEVREKGGAVQRVAPLPSRPVGVTGAGTPGGGVFLAWVREAADGPRLETVILSGGEP